MKTLATIFFFLLGAVGLIMSVCGALVTVSAILDFRNASVLLAFALPSILIGVALYRKARVHLRGSTDVPGGGP